MERNSKAAARFTRYDVNPWKGERDTSPPPPGHLLVLNRCDVFESPVPRIAFHRLSRDAVSRCARDNEAEGLPVEYPLVLGAVGHSGQVPCAHDGLEQEFAVNQSAV